MNLARVFLRGAAALEVEEIVDVLLEHLRAGEALGIAFGQLAHPLRAHPHMRDLIGEDVVDGALDNRIAHLLRQPDELLEDIAREALEPAIDARDAARGVINLRARPQDFGLGKFAEIRPDVLQQLHVDFGVTRLVPHLARHIELEFPRRIGEVEERAARGLHRLQLSRTNPVQSRAQKIFFVWHRVEGREALVDARLAHLVHRDQDVIFGPRELIDRRCIFPSNVSLPGPAGTCI